MTFTARRAIINEPLLPAGLLPAYSALAARADEKHGGFLTVTLALPRRPRSTGPHSQNAHINGHIQTIAEETGCSFDAVKAHVKRLAVDHGYPFATLPDGSIAPKSEADASVEDAIVLIETIHAFAAEYGIALKEGDE